MLRVLIVEDEDDSVRPILRLIDERGMDVQPVHCDFGDAATQLREFRPNIVVLDLWEGEDSDKENKGEAYLDFIWNHQFCPVIIHSAEPELPDEQRNAFVREVTKGQHSPGLVLDAIQELRPHVETLQEAEEHIRDSFSLAMRDVAPSTFDLFESVEKRNDAIKRAGRRRLAALMDDIPGDGGNNLASWEQYLCPPISRDTVLGDVLMKADQDKDNPASFRVVLTPSCDLASNNGSEPKVKEALVSKCYSMKAGLDLTSWNEIALGRLKNRLIGSALSQGYFETVIPFPRLQGKIPTMVADLRGLELISLQDIGLSDTKFLRVASLDSPFRELVSWAYIQVSGRPGLPTRDFASWRDEILAVYGKQP